MQAFSSPLALPARPCMITALCHRPCVNTKHVPAQKYLWQCSAESNGGASSGDDETSRAIASSSEIRARLRTVREERERKYERTQEALREISEQISKIMDKVRAQSGMPPLERKDNEDEEVADRKGEGESGEGSDGPETIRVGVDSGTGEDGNVDDDDDEPYSNPKNFGYESSAGWQLLTPGDDLPASEGDIRFRIKCDINGCSLIVQRDGEPAGRGVRERYVVSGKGYRVGYDPESPRSFCGMVGNDQWLLALSEDEMRHFKRLMLALQNKMRRIDEGKEDPPLRKPAVRRGGDGMFNERVGRTGGDLSVELESKLLWAQAFGTPDSYGIRTIFMEGRQSEGYWPPEVVPEMLKALLKLQIT